MNTARLVLLTSYGIINLIFILGQGHIWIKLIMKRVLPFKKLDFQIKCLEREDGHGNHGIHVYHQGKTVIATDYRIFKLILVYKQNCLHQSRLV